MKSLIEASKKWDQAISGTAFPLLSDPVRVALREAAEAERLSFQMIRRMVEMLRDLEQWGEPLGAVWVQELRTSAAGAKEFFRAFEARYEERRGRERVYSQTPVQLDARIRRGPARTLAPSDRIIGPCPVASERTRCCQLLTLDTVRNCPSSCSYCAIQSFFHSQDLLVETDLRAKLDAWVRSSDFDPGRMYHIGTGQSSDSLQLGDTHGVLGTLFDFTREHPNVLLELKTKSGRIDEVLRLKPPSRVFCSWSLNPEVVIRNEEHGTASLEERLQAARNAADAGIRVGFHFHPILDFTGWREQYRALVSRVIESFSAEEVVLVSLGTLTFIKSLPARIRNLPRQTQVLRMPLVETAGKLSYPLERKRELFREIFDAFGAWQKDSRVFFYLCMEDPVLWNQVLGREFGSNAEFENALNSHLQERLSEKVTP